MKRFKNEVISNFAGEDLEAEIDGVKEKMKLWNVINIILNNAPFKTQEDSKEGVLLALALKESKDKDTIEIEESTHEWLKKVAKELTPPMFRLNANVVYEHIKEGFEKAHQPKDKEN